MSTLRNLFFISVSYVLHLVKVRHHQTSGIEFYQLAAKISIVYILVASKICLKIVYLDFASCIENSDHSCIHSSAKQFFTVSGLSEIFKENRAVNCMRVSSDVIAEFFDDIFISFENDVDAT